MSRRYLLDTNVISNAIGPERAPGIVERIRRYWDSISTASVVWCELLYGLQRLPEGTRRSVIELYLDEMVATCVPILPYDEAAAAWHASERVRLERAGTPPSFSDGQIAAIAAVHQLVLVTSNVADFKRFSNLRVEDWRK